jgi:hypothetical protein
MPRLLDLSFSPYNLLISLDLVDLEWTAAIQPFIIHHISTFPAQFVAIV